MDCPVDVGDVASEEIWPAGCCADSVERRSYSFSSLHQDGESLALTLLFDSILFPLVDLLLGHLPGQQLVQPEDGEGGRQEVVEPVEADAAVEDDKDAAELQRLRQTVGEGGPCPGRPVSPGGHHGGGHGHSHSQAGVGIQAGDREGEAASPTGGRRSMIDGPLQVPCPGHQGGGIGHRSQGPKQSDCELEMKRVHGSLFPLLQPLLGLLVRSSILEQELEVVLVQAEHLDEVDKGPQAERHSPAGGGGQGDEEGRQKDGHLGEP